MFPCCLFFLLLLLHQGCEMQTSFQCEVWGNSSNGSTREYLMETMHVMHFCCVRVRDGSSGCVKQKVKMLLLFFFFLCNLLRFQSGMQGSVGGSEGNWMRWMDCWWAVLHFISSSTVPFFYFFYFNTFWIWWNTLKTCNDKTNNFVFCCEKYDVILSNYLKTTIFHHTVSQTME